MANLQDMSDAELDAHIDSLSRMQEMTDQELNANIAQSTHDIGKNAGLSEDEISRNYALKVAQRGEEPTTLLGMKALPSWVPLVGGKPATTEATATPDPALGLVGRATQNLPIAGAAMPTTKSMDWMAREHPTADKVAGAVGQIAGTVPAMAMMPGGWIGSLMGGGALRGGDAAARQVLNPQTWEVDSSKFQPMETAKQFGYGMAEGGAGRLMSRLLSPTNIVHSKYQFPEFEHLPEGVQNTLATAQILGSVGKSAVMGDWGGVLRKGVEAGLGHAYVAPKLYNTVMPGVNRAIANKANPVVQDTINALLAGLHPNK